MVESTDTSQSMSAFASGDLADPPVGLFVLSELVEDSLSASVGSSLR